MASKRAQAERRGWDHTSQTTTIYAKPMFPVSREVPAKRKFGKFVEFHELWHEMWGGREQREASSMKCLG